MLKQLPMTARLMINNVGSVNRDLQRPEKNQDSYCRTRESSVCILGHRHQLVPFQPKRTGFQQFKLLRDNRISDDRDDLPLRGLTSLVFVICFTRNLWCFIYPSDIYLSSGTLTNQVLCCWADGGFEKLKRVRRRFFSPLAFFPTRPDCHTALLRSRWLNTRLSPGV